MNGMDDKPIEFPTEQEADEYIDENGIDADVVITESGAELSQS